MIVETNRRLARSLHKKPIVPREATPTLLVFVFEQADNALVMHADTVYRLVTGLRVSATTSREHKTMSIVSNSMEQTLLPP